MERYELAKNRIMELETEIDGAFGDYIREAAHLFVTIFHVMDGTEDVKQRKEWTDNLYEEIAGDNYETSYANPAYCVKKFGEKTGQYLCWFYARFRDSIVAAFEEDEEEVTRCMELFLQVVSVLSLEEETERYLLPKKIGDSDIKWYESGENKAPYIAVLILILGIFYIWAGKRKEEEKNKKRTDDLKKEYPELISRIILLLYSGATMRNALFYIGDSYRKSMADMKDRKKNEAFEEVVITYRQMQSGVTELKAYGNMADRCALPCYRTLSIMLMQNQKRGSKGMIASLEQEVINEFAEKKRKVKSEGEIASMKLLLPLGLMLMIVFALIMVPAFFSI